jgi:hypothetical protein
MGRSRPPVRAFLVFVLVLIAALVVQRALQPGLLPARVEAFYLGSDGGEPLGATALWEEVHAGAFLYGCLWVTLGSLLAACPVPGRLRGALFGSGVAAALLDLFDPFLIVALRRGGLLRVAGFAAAMAFLLASVAAVWLTYGKVPRRDDA